MGDTDIVDREVFFGSLPANEFTQLETALRQTLVDWLHAKPGPFPLIEWIDRRLGGEIRTSRDENGQAEISFQTPGDVAPQGASLNAETFFESLPGDSFSPAEEALRKAIFDFLASWKSQDLANLAHLSAERGVQDRRLAFMPNEVTLADWIERRIGGEVELRKDVKGQYIIHLTAAARPLVAAKYHEMMNPSGPKAQPQHDASGGKGGGKAIAKEAFFNGLPTNELAPEETALREALLVWLSEWPKGRPPNRAPNSPSYLGDAGQDLEVARCRAALLPSCVPLREWIDRRIGGEVGIRKDDKGQLVIMIQGVKGAAKGASKGGPKGGHKDDIPPAHARASEACEAFFSTLPMDELSREELALREAVLNYAEAHASDPSPLLLSDACKNRAIAQTRSKLLPPEVPLRLWLERRIGGEIGVVRDEANGVFVLQPRRTNDAGAVGKEGKDMFFESLPDDKFTEEEEGLRDALLGFLAGWKDKEPPTLSHAGSDPEVRRSRGLVLPKGTPVSLKEWIDRRMGGEIEMMADATGQFMFGIRGELDHAAAARKRKAVRPDMGTDPRGKGRSNNKGGSPVRDLRSGGGPPWKKMRNGPSDGKGPSGRPPPRR